jgi:hypothetical protein
MLVNAYKIRDHVKVGVSGFITHKTSNPTGFTYPKK